MRKLVIGFVVLALAGCISTRNTLTSEQVASLKLVRVDVAAAPDARISWEDGYVAYAALKGVPAQDWRNIANTPEARASVGRDVATHFKDAMERELMPSLNGTRPVKLDVTVSRVDIPSVTERVLIGGDNIVEADARLLDAKTGQLVLNLPKQLAFQRAGGGVSVLLDPVVAGIAGAPIDRVVTNYARQYRIWLLNP